MEPPWQSRQTGDFDRSLPVVGGDQDDLSSRRTRSSLGTLIERSTSAPPGSSTDANLKQSQHVGNSFIEGNVS